MSSISAPVLTLACPTCRKSLRVPATAQGKNGKCPACQAVFKVPVAQTAPAVAPKAPNIQVAKAVAPQRPLDSFDFAPQPGSAQSKDMTFPDLSAEAPAKIKYPVAEEHGPIGAAKKGVDKGVLGGIAMIVGAVIWFVVGYLCGYIFFYPPILLIIGIVAVIKGLATGNISGRKPTKKIGN